MDISFNKTSYSKGYNNICSLCAAFFGICFSRKQYEPQVSGGTYVCSRLF